MVRVDEKLGWIRHDYGEAQMYDIFNEEDLWQQITPTLKYIDLRENNIAQVFADLYTRG